MAELEPQPQWPDSAPGGRQSDEIGIGWVVAEADPSGLPYPHGRAGVVVECRTIVAGDGSETPAVVVVGQPHGPTVRRYELPFTALVSPADPPDAETILGLVYALGRERQPVGWVHADARRWVTALAGVLRPVSATPRSRSLA